MQINYLPAWAIGLLLAGLMLIFCEKELQPTTPTQPVDTSKSGSTGMVKQGTFSRNPITYQEIVNELSKLKYYLPNNNIALRLH